MSKTVFITGASSGIGLASAKFFFAKGWDVVATMRSPDKDTELKQLDPKSMQVLRLDLQDLASIKSAVEAAIAKFQKIDLLLNNAGYGQNGLFETISREQIQAQFDVNLFGLMDVIRTVLPHFQDKHSGGIINVSSGGGVYALPIMSIYCASKFALEGFTEALAYELASQNIWVKSVIPHGGVTNTNFGAGGLAGPDAPESYKPFVEKVLGAYGKTVAARSISSEDVAKVVFEAATDGTDRLRYLVGNDSRGFMKARYESKNDEEYVTYMRSFFQ
ncbi:hypothetical protein GALMADRAFT_93446 [Galerina marginata CBS 339.88]|uniref:Short-chain dehydrogenase/reductase SDR n=1 Tax=Galerina marginata (strain CBS 339.88) TaxID=685588 RepID=A0A067T8T1_GALM3|nr:hypothetical protein GALMADRAFT_93446 [Galerina marginata CBS 339.88]